MDTEKFETNFRSMIFANNPELYYEMFEKQDYLERQDIEDEMEWVIPDSPEEVQRLLNELPNPQ